MEELNIVVDEMGKKNRRSKNMERYAPLIFEECYVVNSDKDTKEDVKKKVDPSISDTHYKGMHLFVLVHGF